MGKVGKGYKEGFSLWDREVLRQSSWSYNTKCSGAPWWLSSKESTCQCRRQVQTLIQEDPTCPGTAKHHNYWACALEPRSRNYWTHGQNYCSPNAMEPLIHDQRHHCNERLQTAKSGPHLPQLKKGPHGNRDPARQKINIKLFWNAA